MLGLALLGIGGPTPPGIVARARAQVAGPADVDTVAPNVPRAGWAYVLSASPKWIVLQNDRGFQYPVSVPDIGLFLMRWPITVDRIKADALIEANGIDQGSNRLQTNHVDVYQGAARDLVRPAMFSPSMVQILPNVSIQANLFQNMYQPMFGAANGPLMTNPRPSQMQIVGPMVNIVPPGIQLGLGNNNWATVVPANPAGGLSMSLVTMGLSSQLKRGDLVFYLADTAAPKGLVLLQLVVYKNEFYPD
jgi:hypothetical protein